MRGLFFAVLMLGATPAYAEPDYQAADGNRYYRMNFALAPGLQLTAGAGCCSDGIEYSKITPPKTQSERHYLFTADMDQTALSLYSYEKIIKAEYLPSGSIYISGEGPTLHLATIQTREAWKELPVSKDGRTVSLEGLDSDTHVSLPAISTEQIVAATRTVLTEEFDNSNAEFWLGLAKECRIENGVLSGACSLHVRQATVKLTFEHEAPVFLTIEYIVGC